MKSKSRLVIFQVKTVLKSRDACLITMYKSRNAELKKCHMYLMRIYRDFYPNWLTHTILEHFGDLSPLKILLDDPKVITTLATTYGWCLKEFRNVACQSYQNIWICGENKIMNFYNLHGEVIRSFETWSKNCPKDISIAKEEDYLLFTD